jgi:hypothetical protein
LALLMAGSHANKTSLVVLESGTADPRRLPPR